MNEYASLEQLVAAGMPEHQLQAIRDGGAAPFQGKTYTAESLGISAASGLSSAVADAQQVAALRKENDDLKAKIAEIEAAHEAKAKKSHKAEPKAEEKAPEKEGE